MVRLPNWLAVTLVFALAPTLTSSAAAPRLTPQSRQITLREGLNLRTRGRAYFSRWLLPGRDPVSNQLLRGEWKFPATGEHASVGDGTWEPIAANQDGVFEQARGYLAFQVDSDVDTVAVLESSEHSIAYVNGVPHTRGLTLERQGTPTPVPVAPRKGLNEFVFRARGIGFHAYLAIHDSTAVLSNVDATLPDLVIAQHEPLWAGMVLLNSSNEPITGLTISARIDSATKKANSNSQLRKKMCNE